MGVRGEQLWAEYVAMWCPKKTSRLQQITKFSEEEVKIGTDIIVV